MNAGDLALVSFPFSASVPVASEQYKRRPVLVLNHVGTGDDEAILCAMVTGTTRRWLHPGPSDVPLGDWHNFGLAKESVVRTRRIWTAQTRDLTRVIGAVDRATLDTVRRLVVDLVGVPADAPATDN